MLPRTGLAGPGASIRGRDICKATAPVDAPAFRASRQPCPHAIPRGWPQALPLPDRSLGRGQGPGVRTALGLLARLKVLEGDNGLLLRDLIRCRIKAAAPRKAAGLSAAALG